MSEVLHENVGQDVASLHKQLGELRNQVEDYYNEALVWKAKRDDLNKSVSQLVSELKQEREERKRANGKVAELKVIKQGFEKELEEKRSLIDGLQEKKRESLSSIKDDPEYVRQRIKKLEWFLQTNVLSLSEENRLVKEVSALEKKVTGTKVADEIDGQLSELVARARGIQGTMNQYKSEMLEHVKVSQRHHAAILDLMKKIADAKKDADSAHEKYLDLFGHASQALSNLKKIQDKIRELSDKIRAQKESRRNDRSIGLERKSEEVAAQAFEKVKKGTRITMDELSVLVEKGFFNDRQKP